MSIYINHIESNSSGIPLALLHGWGLNHRVWSEVSGEFVTQRNVLGIDLPGHGQSKMLDDGYSLANVSKSIHDAINVSIRNLNEQKIMLLGWSLGGLTAMNIAIENPEFVAGLILLSSSPQFARTEDWPHGMAPELLAGFASDLQNDYQETVQRFLALQSMGSLRAKEEIRFLRDALLGEKSEGESDTTQTPDPNALEGGLALLQHVNLRPALKKISCPTLIINGERDRLVNPQIGTQMCELIPQARHVVIESAGHAAFISHQDRFVELVEEFINEA